MNRCWPSQRKQQAMFGDILQEGLPDRFIADLCRLVLQPRLAVANERLGTLIAAGRPNGMAG